VQKLSTEESDLAGSLADFFEHILGFGCGLYFASNDRVTVGCAECSSARPAV
jgi:hypothetical protein